jgi:hypothetical protein
MPSPRQDDLLVEHLIRCLNDTLGTTFCIVEQPDHTNRAEESVEAIAIDDQGRRLAVEHTQLQAFVQPAADNARQFTAGDDWGLFKELAVIESDPSLVVVGFDIDVSVRVGAFREVKKWRNAKAGIVDEVRRLLRETAPTLPEGLTVHSIEVGGQTIEIELDKSEIGGDGSISLARSAAPPWDLEPVRKALVAKLPKLVATPADIRILLLEKYYLSPSSTTIANDLAVLAGEFPALAQVSEVWLATTADWHNEKRKVQYAPLWPDPDETRLPRPFATWVAVPRPEDLNQGE